MFNILVRNLFIYIIYIFDMCVVIRIFDMYIKWRYLFIIVICMLVIIFRVENRFISDKYKEDNKSKIKIYVEWF